MKLKIARGTTQKIVRLFVQDSTATSGAGLVGLTNASSGLLAYYIREGDSSATAITLAAGTVGVYSSGGFKEVDSTHMPGLYELGLPNAALASGNSVLIYLQGATSMVPTLLEIELDALNYQDGTAAGLTAVPLAMAQAVPTSNSAQTVGDALNAARAQGFGKWALSGTSLTLYAADGTTVVRTFVLDSATAPTSRT